MYADNTILREKLCVSYIKLRSSGALVLGFLLTVLAGTVSAQDQLGQPIKPENAPSDWGKPVYVQAQAPATITGGVIVVSSPGIRHVTDLPPVAVFASANRSPSQVNDPSGCQNKAGEPIEINSGTKQETIPIFALPGEMGLAYVLYYNRGGVVG